MSETVPLVVFIFVSLCNVAIALVNLQMARTNVRNAKRSCELVDELADWYRRATRTIADQSEAVK